MFPELLDGPHFSAVLILAALLGTLTHLQLATRLGIPPRPLLRFLLAFAVVALLGAKLFSMALDSPQSLARGLGAHSFRYPGAVLAVLVALPGLRRLLPPGLTLRGCLDLLIPGTCVALAVIRLDCLIAGCCTGSVCQLPWCLRFPAGSRPWVEQVSTRLLPFDAAESLPVHPLSLYLMALALVLAWAALEFLPRRSYQGQVALLFLAVHESAKFLLEFLRFPRLPALQWPSLALALGSTVALAILWVRRRRDGSMRPAPP